MSTSANAPNAPALYILDDDVTGPAPGESPFTLATLVAANADAPLAPEEIAAIEALAIGESATFGGGAQPEWTITRVGDVATRAALADIAASLAALPHGASTVSLGVSTDAFALLVSIGGKKRTFVYAPGEVSDHRDGWMAIDACSVEVGNVAFHASMPRRAATLDDRIVSDEPTIGGAS